MDGKFDSWRGSPKLLAQAASVCERAVGGTTANLEIDFHVADDHEIFSTTGDFLDRVSKEALAKFNTVHIRAHSDDLEVDVMLLRHGLRGPRVRVQVTGTDQDAVERAFRAVTASVKRGDTVEGLRTLGLFAAGGAYGLMLVFGFIYLFGDPGWLGIIPIIAGGVIVVAVLEPRIYNNVEVALPGETRLAGALKAAAALATAVAAGAIGKAFFGG